MSLLDFISECHNELVQSKNQESSLALEYLTKRNLLNSSILLNKIGYCSREKNIPDYVRFYGQDSLEENKKWDASRFIKGRIIVPIYSEFGKLVGFATRTPSSLPGNTWWNISFKKSHHIFMMNMCRKEVFKQNKIYLVEGYMDALILFQQGLKNIGCIMGTSLMTRKIALIARYCNNVCLCFDVDKNESGQKAQNTSIAALKKFDFCEKISVIDGLPIGEDPDTFVIHNGLESFLAKEHILKPAEIKKICKNVFEKSKGIVYAQ